MDNYTKKRIRGLEYIRAFACIAIIFIHTIYAAIGLFGENLSLNESIVYRGILNNLMWAVPCFFMVTGALLLNPEKEIGYRKLFTKYIARMVMAIAIFGFIFTLLELIVAPEKQLNDFLYGLYEVFAGKSWSHMWYLYSLIGLYLFLPFYKMVTSQAKKNDIAYLLSVYVIFLSLLPLLRIAKIECGFLIHVATIYPFWLFYGYYMKQWGLQKRLLAYALIVIIATILLVVTTWARWKWNYAPLEMFFGYSSILIIVQTTGIFGLLYHIPICKLPRLEKLVLFIDRHSFGIYLMHLIFIRGIYKQLHYNPLVSGGLLGMLGVVVISLILSLILDIILKKLPVFRWIL